MSPPITLLAPNAAEDVVAAASGGPGIPEPPDVPARRLGRTGRPHRFERPALWLLLVATAGAYLTNLAASGYGNTFYAAAVEAGSKSWKAMFFGSLDSSNFITVDKPPAALWIMDLSARIFGFSTWSVMVPEVLEGVAAVALLYACIRRLAGPVPGLAAGAILACTPVAALMFRFDNPDALLVLLLVAAAYCMTRALEGARTRWIVAVGALLGFAFLTKMLQAFAVVPGFGAAYLIAAPTGMWQRVKQLAASLVALLIAGGWWVAIVALLPASSRPFIDGSPDNSILNLIFVYNGFGRLTGSSGNGANFSGDPGFLRLFNNLMGSQASWLIPAALVGFVVIVVSRRSQPRTDPVRAAAIVFGGWLVVTGAIFSFGKGIIHTYYTVALVPAIAALVALGGHELWKHRDRRSSRVVASSTILATCAWAWTLLERTPTWNPWLRFVVVATGILASSGILVGPSLGSARRAIERASAILAIVACLAAPVAFTADTVATAHTGGTPSAGPTSALAGFGGGGSGGGAPSGGGFGGGAPSGRAPSGRGGGFGSGTGGSSERTGSVTPPSGSPGSNAAGVSTNAALVRALEHDASKYRWVAAVDGSQSAATLELATSGEPVMAIGGFDGEGGRLSLAEFKSYVAAGDIHYFIAGSSGGPGGYSSDAIATWVAAHYRSVTIGGTELYVLSSSGTSLR